MDYLDILQRALNITWKNKYLWILGFFIALAGGGTNFSNSSNYNFNNSGKNLSGAGAWVGSYLIVILLIVLILLFLWFIIWILSVISHGGLVGAVNDIEEGKVSSLGRALSIGAHYFWRVFGIGILLGLVSFILAMIFLVPMIAGIVLIALQGNNASGALVSALICLVPAVLFLVFMLVVVGAVMGVINNYAVRFAVIRDNKVIQSIKNAWALIKECKTETFITFLLLLLTSSLYGLVMLVPGLILGLPSVLMIITGAATKNVALIALGAVGVMSMVLVMAALRGVYEVFHSSGWTLVFRRISS